MFYLEEYEIYPAETPQDVCGLHYGKYAGTYAQEIAGYSDEAIDIALDGDPDAYWNID